MELLFNLAFIRQEPQYWLKFDIHDPPDEGGGTSGSLAASAGS